MRKFTLALSVAALALSGATVAAARGPGDRTGPDADKNGQVTQAEMQAHNTAMFQRMDANGDGQIDAADREAMKAKMFARLDANGDGQVTQAEMQAGRPGKARDGAAATERPERAERMAERFAALDIDKSGGLSQAELEAGHKERGPRPEGAADGEKRGGHRMGHRGGMFGMRADGDGNKVVTRAEFDATATARFAKADTNGDGVIGADEMKAMHPGKRGGERHHRGPAQDGAAADAAPAN